MVGKARGANIVVRSPRWLRALPAVGTVTWLLVVTYLAVRVARVFVSQLPAFFAYFTEARSGWYVALGTVGAASAVTIAVGLARPDWWRRAVLGLAVAPVPVLLVTSRNVLAGCAAVGLLLPALWLGRVLAARLLRRSNAPYDWVVGGAFGVGALALLGLTLGRVGALRPQVIWSVVLVATLALLLTTRRRLRADATGFLLRLKRPVVGRVEDFAVAGLLLGHYWLSLIGALAPEVMSDAVRQRLATAAYFARMGRLAVDPGLSQSGSPGVGELVYAVALASGPLQTAKLLNLAVGLLCAAGVWALGRRLGGPRAGAVAALVFYTLPMTVWLSQTAYIDLFATLFAVAAALATVLGPRLQWGAASVATICIGLGLTVKLSFGLVACGLVVALVLFALWCGGPVARALVVAMLALSLLVTLLAGLTVGARVLARVGDSERTSTGSSALRPSLVVDAVGHAWHAREAQAITGVDLFGGDRSLAALVRSPLDLTLKSRRYTSIEAQNGFTGYLLLALVPLSLVARPNRRTIVTLVGALVAYLAWFYFAQYLRYAVPVFATLAAVGAAAYTGVSRRITRRAASVVMGVLPVVLVVCSLVGYLNTVLFFPGTPYRVVLGWQDESGYLAERVSAYEALQLLDAQSDATLALAYEPARLYTRVGLRNFTETSGMNARELLQYLDREGYSHVLVDRTTLPPRLAGILVISEEFLRWNAALVGGGHNAYLYRLVPPEQRGREQPWASGRELLDNGGFEEAVGERPRRWRPFGQPKYDASYQESYTGRGAVLTRPGSGYTVSVDVVPDTRYLLSHATRGTTDNAQARLWITWLGANERPVGESLELVPVSPSGYHLHSMLATSPPTAVTAVIYAEPQEGEVWFDGFSLRSLAGEGQ